MAHSLDDAVRENKIPSEKTFKRFTFLFVILMLICGCIAFLWPVLSHDFNELIANLRIPSIRKDFLSKVEQVYIEDDILIASEVTDFEVRQLSYRNPPDCIVGSAMKTFGTNDDFETTQAKFSEILEVMGWNQRLTDDDRMGYRNEDEHMWFILSPSTDFETNNQADYSNLYTINYLYNYPDADWCYDGDKS